MNQDSIAIAKDNTIRTSSLKLANIARSIVNKKVNNAVNQLKFSNKRIANNVLKNFYLQLLNKTMRYFHSSSRSAELIK